jgi:hypothetical protein
MYLKVAITFRRTSVEIKEILVDALRAVREAEIPTELQPIAFAKAIDLAAGPKMGGPAVDQSRQLPTNTGESSFESGDLLQRIATKLNLDRDIVSHVYYANPDGRLEIVVSPSKLPPGYGPATRDLALLIAAGRQAAGIDAEWTPADDIRQVAEHFKRLDGPNFATHIKQMEEVFLVRGTSHKREVKMTAPAWVAATDLVKRLGPVA